MDERARLDDTRPPTAAEALAIIRHEQARTGKSLRPSLPIMYGVWGVAWLLIGIGYWAAAAGRIADEVAATGLVVVLLVAVAVSTTVASRSGRGVRGAGDLRSRRYGLSWAIGMGGAGLLIWGLERAGLPAGLQAPLYSSMFVLVAGLLYLAGALIWEDNVQYALGAWTVLVAVLSVHAGAPGAYLVMGIGGGGGLLVAAAVQHRRCR